MNNQSIKRIVLIIGLILIILLNSMGMVYAVSSRDLRRQQSSIDDQIKAKNSELAGVKSQKSSTLTQISKLTTEISNYQDEINTLQGQINTLQSEITEKTSNIQEQQEKYDAQNELLEKRLVALYESGTVSYLDMLLSSDGLADFISKYYLIEQLAEADKELLQKIDNTKKQIENEKASLEATKTEIENSKSTVNNKKNSLQSSVNQKNSLVSNLSEEEKKIQEELEEFEKDKAEIQKQLAALAAKSSGKAVAPSAAGYISPLSGKTKSNITTGYYGYSGHTGVDFACGAGTPVRAVKSGKVITSTALRRPNGSYKSYGEYVVIDHNDGTMTLYAHMLSGSRTVSPGQKVSQGQTIGKVGSTGNSTGNHLHFEVRVGGRPRNPTPYLP